MSENIVNKSIDNDHDRKLMDFLENELETDISEQQKMLLLKSSRISASEKNDLIDAGLWVESPSSERMLAAAEKKLRRWSREYRSGDYSFIQRLTSAFKTGSSRPSPERLEDEEARRIQSVVNKMMQDNKEMVYLHYIDKPPYMAKLYNRNPQKEGEINRSYKSRIEKIYLKVIDFDRRTYLKLLKNAHIDFNLRGGLG